MKPSSHRRLLLAAACGFFALLAGRAARADEPPRMDPDQPVACFTDEQGVPWRSQCSDEKAGGARVCVVAIDGEIDELGQRARGLERARPCAAGLGFDRAGAEQRGYKLVRGVADAPRGWMRDERGRVFQVTFDLRKRLYAGVGWAPTLRRPGGADSELGRASLDFGLFELETSTGSRKSGYRHRLHLAEGSVRLAPFGADVTALRYDFSRTRADPLFRITTFFGRPRRFDIDAHLGGWFEAGHVELREVAPGRDETLWRWATAHLTWDLWRTPGLESFVRLRGGAGLERAQISAEVDRDAVSFAGAIEGDLTLGDSGFNRVIGLAQLERPTYTDLDRVGPDHARRALVRLGYERILIAVNDQPVTLRVAGEAEYRNDVPDAPKGWDVRAMAGLRLNLWAPPR